METKEVSTENVEKAETRANLAAELTEDERKLQRKLKLKLDFLILPLLATIYFFAQMVRLDFNPTKLRFGTDDN